MTACHSAPVRHARRVRTSGGHPRPWGEYTITTLAALLLLLLAPDIARAACGGNLERWCCVWEGARCDSGKVAIANVGPGDGDACATSRLGVKGKSGGTCYSKDSSGYPTYCGGSNEPPCPLTIQISQGIRSCKSGLFEYSGLCRAKDADGYPTFCGGTDETACNVVLQVQLGIKSCKSGLRELVGTSGSKCRAFDGDGFPSHCGGPGEPACLVTEHVPSCKSATFERSGTCEGTDADGYPTFCGGNREPACNVLLQAQLKIRACKTGHYELNGICQTADRDGFPPFCGDPGEDACLVNFQVALGIDACKPTAYNDFGKCKSLDRDGFPAACGDLNETPCKLDEQVRLGIKSCKPRLEENFELNLCVNSCGGNGLPACVVGGCDSGLTVQSGDSIDGYRVCGAAPIAYGESDANEAPRHGPRTVFFIHGRGGDLTGVERRKILKRLAFKSTNVAAVYGVDWNNTPVPRGSTSQRRLRIARLGGSFDAPKWVSWQSYGRREFNARTFRIVEVAQAIAEGIVDLDIRTPITIVTHSFGGVIGRQLVYRHYDELRKAGHKIVEVVTVKGPHRGGLIGTPDVTANDLLGRTSTGLRRQTEFACITGRVGDLLGFGAGQDGCQLGLWVEWALQDAPVAIDDGGYPQIRWVTVAGGGHRIGKDAIDAMLNATANVAFRRMLQNERNTDHEPFQDSDETVTTRSAFGIAADECYPYLRSAPPGRNTTSATVIFDLKTWDGKSSLSATCYHAGAATAPAPATRATSKHGFPPDTGVPKEEETFVFSSIAVPDEDNDGVGDDADNCWTVPNKNQENRDGDAAGDVCDAFPDDPKETVDTDRDGIGNNADQDDDGDKLTDVQEPPNGTKPLDPDSDDDKLLDGFEVRYGFDPTNEDDDSDARSDSDGDGLTALEEQRAGTNPRLADTDGDGIDDGVEILAGTNPLAHNRYQAVMGIINMILRD